ncbi:Nif3-like dinuclear metal center hexameric protein [Paenibacillus illinoisensis]|uniref:Nif3-like dinuclear metal center hexameric protein n=1 Tax=Paenibacillus illinoisensis TaxID=59845 RepID=UPI003D269554
MFVQEVIDTIITDSCGDFRLEKTCDKLICGNPDTKVTGIVTTYMATVDVIKQAVACRANMIITHEPTFYTGKDINDWLDSDELFAAKKKLIEENEIAIWRYHDYMHRAKTDRIYDGFMHEIEWDRKLLQNNRVYEINEVTLEELAEYLKQKLSMSTIQIVGNPHMKCTRVGILLGGGSLGLGREQMPMELMREEKLDVMICGEIMEWTLCAYVNDATMLGLNKGMIVLGHERSEEAGMKYMAHWLAPLVEGTMVTFIDAKEPFTYL